MTIAKGSKSKLILSILLLCSAIVSAQNIRIEIESDSLFVNSKRVIKQVTLNQLKTIVGNPDRILSKPFSTEWIYDKLGLRILITPKDSILDAIEFDYIKYDIDFFPEKNFMGTFIIDGVQISSGTSIVDFEKIKEINFKYSFPTYYSAYTRDLKMVFVYTLDKKLKSAGISFQ